jgi:hypothetical protein
MHTAPSVVYWTDAVQGDGLDSAYVTWRLSNGQLAVLPMSWRADAFDFGIKLIKLKYNNEITYAALLNKFSRFFPVDNIDSLNMLTPELFLRPVFTARRHARVRWGRGKRIRAQWKCSWAYKRICNAVYSLTLFVTYLSTELSNWDRRQNAGKSSMVVFNTSHTSR